MRLAFCSSNSILSLIIRALSMGKWSHVAIVDGTNVIEAVWPKVRVVSLDHLRAQFPVIEMVDVELPDEIAGLRAAYGEIGKPYDIKALFSFLVHRDWADPRAWFCSELTAWAMEQGGKRIFRPASLEHIHPTLLWYVAI